MKIRVGFVSNSSSSSFICEICGEGDVYHDSVSLSDIGMCSCVNGHMFCEEHKLTDEEENEDCEIPETSCPICQFQIYSTPELVEYLKKKYKVAWELVFEEIKQLNKRRKKLYDYEYIKYVFDKFELNENSVMIQLKNEFKTYEDYRKYIRQ